jgi:hypothetical protein
MATNGGTVLAPSALTEFVDIDDGAIEGAAGGGTAEDRFAAWLNDAPAPQSPIERRIAFPAWFRRRSRALLRLRIRSLAVAVHCRAPNHAP